MKPRVSRKSVSAHTGGEGMHPNKRLDRRPGWSAFALLYLLSGLFFFATPQQSTAALSAELQQALDSSKYVYIQSERKSGALGAKAEIWFMRHDGAVWVASQKTTHRAKRIQAGRTKAKVWVGAKDGPAIDAQGSVVKDTEINDVLFAKFAKQYPDRWSKHEANFRTGLADGGSYALIKYTPVASTAGAPATAGALSAEQQQALDSSKYVYIQSERKSGAFGSKAEIWFFHHDGAVWVGTPVATHRVKRIQAGRTKAKVWIGSQDGPSFDATGSIVTDEAVNEILFETFAKKYANGWSSYGDGFRKSLADGSRVLVRYDPVGM